MDMVKSRAMAGIAFHGEATGPVTLVVILLPPQILQLPIDDLSRSRFQGKALLQVQFGLSR